MLVLFDIDATLIKTSRAGLQAMADAVEEVCGRRPDVDRAVFAGGLDPVIIGELLASIEADPNPILMARIRSSYHDCLRRRLDVPGTAYALPGVHDLLTALDREAPQLTLGLLTGNFRDSGLLKLAAAGITTSRFVVHAFGDEGRRSPPSRRDLLPVACERWAVRLGYETSARDVVLIGDTPRDVDCALHGGAFAIAVATGPHGRPELEAAGAHLTVDDLSATAELTTWIKERSNERRRDRAVR